MVAEMVHSAAEQVGADLRRRVLTGELPPGTPLGEVWLAAEYEVSRATAKTAIETLVSSRLLSRQAHRSARVTVLSSGEVEDIYRTRELIESEVVRRLAQLRMVPEAAREANAEIRSLAGVAPIQLVEPDVRFHSALVESLASARTTAIYRGLSDEIRLCMIQVQGATLLEEGAIAQEHELLLELIAQGSEALAVRLLQEHISRSRRLLSARLRAAATGIRGGDRVL
ncbi:transcriptional regulator NanR [Corynebacterium occultum]|uniref:Transcriptional regulator NanR n=1 Tax=Corynebacterium occultum TaxID=2675219 RepID=A0A6B8W619_9CORY|nr:GntR family transcriptional regulator [Corynebacterium occultum]QGU08031.1 transcriptional regulator NanR [Corynebacterium occultum]